jgi:hypothetical protein
MFPSRLFLWGLPIKHAVCNSPLLHHHESTMKMFWYVPTGFWATTGAMGRSQWPRGLRSTSAAARLLRSCRMDVCMLWVLCVVRLRSLRLADADHSSRGVLPNVARRVCDQETSWMRRPWPALGRSATRNKETNNRSNGTVWRKDCTIKSCRSQWPRGLRRGSAAARLLGLWVRIPPEALMSVSCEWCVMSSRVLCVWLITRPEESYTMWSVWVWSWSLDNEDALAH